ncbi:hypothetical protein BGZ83_007177 [Gryganskiella cystojenkinii]|nr:hypothetical protein BGZ83_007177 [Gryganskiella cystojenkinii]
MLQQSKLTTSLSHPAKDDAVKSMTPMSKSSSLSFDELVHDGNTASVDGWDFSWFNGRATEERPSWGYAKALSDRMSKATAGLDLQTGGGEVLNTVEKFPPLMAATESWPPNLALASKRLGARGVVVVNCYNLSSLPFADEVFDLVVSRHPITVPWDEVARILQPGGTYFAQQIGHRSVYEVREFLLGPQPDNESLYPETARAEAEAAGLEVIQLQFQKTKIEFFDVGAVIYYLRKVVWLIPDFTVKKHRDKLMEMHEHIQTHGSFVAYSSRFLIEARKPM